MKWIKLLYDKPLASVITNCYRLNNFQLHCSTRLGCPLKLTLFALTVAPLAVAIRQDPRISSVNVDNVLLYVSELVISVQRFVDIIAHWIILWLKK